MDVSEWLALHGRELESPWERLFVEQVLARVEKLDFANVKAQHQFVDFNGRQRPADFAIEDEGGRIAIEVKGLAVPNGYRDFVNDAQKALVLRLDGWTVLDFVNSQFGRSMWQYAQPPQPRADGAERCARVIRQELDNNRDIRDARKKAADNPRLLAQVRELAGQREEIRKARNSAVAALAEAQSRNDQLEHSLAEARADREQVAALRLELAQAHAAVDAREAEVAEQDRRAADPPEEQLRQLQAALDRAERKGRDLMRWAIAGVVVISALAIAAVVVMARDKDKDQEVATADSQAASTATTQTAARCDDTVAWGNAAQCIGEPVTTKGPVAGASYQRSTNGEPTFINIGNDFPFEPRLTVMIWGRCRENFPSAPETLFHGKTIYVTGEATTREGIARIEVCSPNQITVEGS